MVLYLICHTTTQADGFYIDFGSVLPGLPPTYGGATQDPGTWMSIGATGMTANLVGISGLMTSAFLILDAENANGTLGTDNGFPDGRLLGDNFYSSTGTEWSITVGGLAGELYDVYYFQPSYSVVSTGDFMVGNQPANPLTEHAKTLISGVTWDVVRDVQVIGGELSISSVSTEGYRGLAGLQIVAVPEPSAYTLVGAGLLVVILVRRLATRGV